MWTSQVYGHHDKMARTKTHRTSQTRSIQRRNIHKEITIYCETVCEHLVIKEHYMYISHILTVQTFDVTILQLILSNDNPLILLETYVYFLVKLNYFMI